MSSINFYLNSPDRKGKCPVMLTYQSNGKRFRYWTKIKIDKNAWKNQRIKPNYKDASENNGILDDLQNILQKIEREAIFNKKEYSIETVKRKFELEIGELSSEGSFFQIYDKFINDSIPTKAAGTIKSYYSTRGHLEGFSQTKNFPINFESINENFYEAFVNYMITDLKFLNNTIGRVIKTLKTFMNYAVRLEYTNPTLAYKNFKVFKEELEIIYLTYDELMRLYHIDDISDTLRTVRDNFCFGCFTGLRFSDISKLSHENIKGDYLEITSEKTKDFIKVPLNHYAKEILNNYKVEFNDTPLPRCFSNQKTNDYLKELGCLAEIDEINTIEKFTGSKKIIITKPKYELITTHTARRTFVTLNLEKGIRAEVVMAMTGHKNYKSFNRYIKITDQIMQIEMNRVWTKPLLKVV